MNVCRLVSELDLLDTDWPDSSLTCSQATTRYVEIETGLKTFQIEEKLSLAKVHEDVLGHVARNYQPVDCVVNMYQNILSRKQP